jgi:hypothetical protein
MSIALALASIACEEGDYLGGLERQIRAGVNGWDMWATEAVRPYEDPMPAPVEGTVPTVDLRDRVEAGRQLGRMSDGERAERAALTYRRYCHHCHGPNGDGRIIVGDHLELKPADLRSAAVQGRSDDELYRHLEEGGRLMLPLAATMSATEMLLAIEELRRLEDRPSKPHFAPRNTEPIE